jgi:hypothetical protein
MKRETKTRHTNPGQFRKGFDPRRHRFTREECVRGFWSAINAIIVRHPEALDAYGRHMAVKFLKKRRKTR